MNFFLFIILLSMSLLPCPNGYCKHTDYKPYSSSCPQPKIAYKSASKNDSVFGYTGNNIKSWYLPAFSCSKNISKIDRYPVFDTIPLDLEEIIKSSDRIFTGNCIRLEEIENDPESNLPIIQYTFEIMESIKGVNDKNEITFKQWRPTKRGAGYEVGEKYILFLYPNSNRGLTSPVGFLQGQFNVIKSGIFNEETVINKVQNFGLTRNLRTQKVLTVSNDNSLNNYLQTQSELGKPIKYREFVQAVRYLVKK